MIAGKVSIMIEASCAFHANEDLVRVMKRQDELLKNLLEIDAGVK